MADQRRLLVLGVDAVSPQLLRAWAADGTLPNVAALMAEGLTGETRGVEGLFDGATWPTFYTGVAPGRHGFYWLDPVKLGTYEKHRYEHFGRRTALWEALSEAGRRVVALDVPLARHSPRVNGVQMVAWGLHDEAFRFQTTPRGLKRRIIKRIGHHPAPPNCDTTRRSLAEYREFADQLIRGAAARGRLTQWILGEEPWDFAIQVFSEAHCAGHQLWHFHDPTHPAYDPQVTQDTGDLVREVYVAVDRAIGDILANLDRDVTIVLMALHGMSYMCGSNFLLSQILYRLGVTTPVRTPRQATSPQVQTGFGSRLASAYHRIPESVRGPLFRFRQRVRRGLRDQKQGLRFDPARTQCFQVDTGLGVSGIRLNLAGREPQGTLKRGPVADAFCASLTRDLLDIVNPDTGRPLVHRVLRTADIFTGECLDMLPDLLVEWDSDVPTGTAVAGSGPGAFQKAFSKRIGLVEHHNTYCRTGEHRIEGILVARGPGIPQGTMPRVVSTLDLAPTFARFLGCDMADVDGQPIPELVPR